MATAWKLATRSLKLAVDAQKHDIVCFGDPSSSELHRENLKAFTVTFWKLLAGTPGTRSGFPEIVASISW